MYGAILTVEIVCKTIPCYDAFLSVFLPSLHAIDFATTVCSVKPQHWFCSNKLHWQNGCGFKIYFSGPGLFNFVHWNQRWSKKEVWLGVDPRVGSTVRVKNWLLRGVGLCKHLNGWNSSLCCIVYYFYRTYCANDSLKKIHACGFISSCSACCSQNRETRKSSLLTAFYISCSF